METELRQPTSSVLTLAAFGPIFSCLRPVLRHTRSSLDDSTLPPIHSHSSPFTIHPARRTTRADSPSTTG